MLNPLPKLITFDGEARSGKGTVVSRVKDYLRDVAGRNVMLIDAGQVFRTLVVKMAQDGVNFDDPDDIDRFLDDSEKSESSVQFVKDVYHMTKQERDKLIYTDMVGENSAKVAGRPLSQEFKDELLRKWLRDARADGFDSVLLDGRALEEVGQALDEAGLCDYVLGLYFICDPVVSAQRCLKRDPAPYDSLEPEVKSQVDDLVKQIKQRNQADQTRAVQPVVRPLNAPVYQMTNIPDTLPPRSPRPMAVIDRSIEVPMDIMAIPIAKLIAGYL